MLKGILYLKGSNIDPKECEWFILKFDRFGRQTVKDIEIKSRFFFKISGRNRMGLVGCYGV
jgi:hypothetical protein